MQCDEVSLLLAATVDDEPLGMPATRHVSSCLRCQAEIVQYRKLRRALAAMRHDLVADDEFLPDLLEVLRPPADVTRLHGGRRRAYLSGIAAAATAGAAGAIVLASRISKTRLAS